MWGAQNSKRGSNLPFFGRRIDPAESPRGKAQSVACQLPRGSVDDGLMMAVYRRPDDVCDLSLLTLRVCIMG